MTSKKIIYTIGHSTHPIEEFIDILKTYEIKQLLDVRSLPGSNKNPQFNQEALEVSLKKAGITYIYLKELGGLRRKALSDSPNKGWHNLSFRNYADYMQGEGFKEGLEEAIEYALKAKSCLMCAEAVPWRCHRSLISDALIIRGWEVLDIFSSKKVEEDKLTSFAKVAGKTITYP